MSGDFQYLDILLLAMIAAFVIFRLRGVLGRRQTEKDDTNKVVELPTREAPQAADEAPESAREAQTPLDAGLTQIRRADRDFDSATFAQGAGAAFEVIVAAFAAGDTGVLRPLLSNEVFENFKSAITDRAAAGRTLETSVVGISSAETVEAHMQGRSAFVTVKFVSEQINVTRDAAGDVVDGDPTHVRAVTDIWTFARNTRSRDPNWTLVETRSQD